MASPAEINQGLPDTLPEDFGEWDNEPSSATLPAHPGGKDSDRGWSDPPKPPTPTPGLEVTPAPAAHKFRGAPLPSPAGAHDDGGAYLRRQTSGAPKPPRLPDSLSQREEAARPAREESFPPQRANLSISDDLSKLIGIPAAATPSPDEFVRQLLQPKIAVTGDKKPPKKNWMMVATVSACSILVLAILAVWLFIPGTPSAARKAGEPGTAAAQTQPVSNVPKPSPSQPLTQDKLPAPTEPQPTADSQPAQGEEEATPPPVQSSQMNVQLAAPSRIPRDIGKPATESEPPSAGLGTIGAETLGGGSTISGAFSGGQRLVVHPAPSNAVTISAGVAVGLLTQKTTPIYPPIAKAARVSGTVEIQATISKTGTIKDMRVVSGPVMLRQAALDAVRTWRYKPYRLNNEPTEVQTTINVIFSLGG